MRRSYVIAIGNSHFDITSYDIYEIKLIYGNNGFGKVPEQNRALIPDWIKTIARGWAKDSLADDEFVKEIQYLIQHGIIKNLNFI